MSGRRFFWAATAGAFAILSVIQISRGAWVWMAFDVAAVCWSTIFVLAAD